MVDDRLWIGLAQHDSRLRERVARSLPRAINGARFKARKLGNPLAHIGAVRVELLSLQHRIEDAEIGRGVDACTRDPLPIEGIASGISVDEGVPEPFLATPPVDEQVLDKEGSG